MSLYVDSSALLKRYVDEPGSDEADALVAGDRSLLAAPDDRRGSPQPRAPARRARDASAAKAAFTRDIAACGIVEHDAVTCEAGPTSRS